MPNDLTGNQAAHLRAITPVTTSRDGPTIFRALSQGNPSVPGLEARADEYTNGNKKTGL